MDKPIPKEILDRAVWRNTRDCERVIDYFKPLLNICDECGIRIEEPRVETCKRARSQLTLDHFKTQCSICKLYKDPETGKFTAKFQEVERYWREQLKTAVFNTKNSLDDK